MPSANTAPGIASRVGLVVLIVHLLLSPLVFSALTVEVFEYNKVLLLQCLAVVLVSLAVGEVLWKAIARPGGEGLNWRGGLCSSLGLEANPAPGAVLRTIVVEYPVSVGVLAFFVSALLSAFFAINWPTSLYGAHESFFGIPTMMGYVVLFLATLYLVRDHCVARALLWAPVAASAAAALYAVVQLVRIDPISWGRTASFGDHTRIFATMGHPNFLSAFLVMAFPICAYMAVDAYRKRRWVVMALLIAVVSVGWAVAVFSISRGAWLALFCALVTLVYGWWRVGERAGAAVLCGVIVTGATAGIEGVLVALRLEPGVHELPRNMVLFAVLDLFAALGVGGFALWKLRGHWRTAALFLACVLLGSSLLVGVVKAVPDGMGLMEKVQQRLVSVAHMGQEARMYIWRAASEMGVEHPVLGVGLDCFQLGFEHYRPPGYWRVEWNGTPTKAHNELLHVFASQGGLGVLALVLLSLGIAIAARRALRRAPTVRDRALIVAIVAGVTAFYVQNFFSFSVAGCATLFVTYAGVLAAVSRRPVVDAERADSGLSLRRYGLALVIGLVTAGTLLWLTTHYTKVFVLMGLGVWLVCIFGLTHRLRSIPGTAEPVRNTDPLSPRGQFAVLALGSALAAVLLAICFPAHTWPWHTPAHGGQLPYQEEALVVGVRALALVFGAMVGVAVAAYRLADRVTTLEVRLFGKRVARQRRQSGEQWVRPGRLGPAWCGRLAVWPLAVVVIYFGAVVPFQANAHCRLGRTLSREGYHVPAINELNRAIELDGSKELYWVQLGSSFYAAGIQEQDARQKLIYLERAKHAHLQSIARVPVNAYNHANLARSLSALAQLNPAMYSKDDVYTVFDRALAIDPYNAYFLGDAGRFALAMGDVARSKSYAQRNRDLYPREYAASRYHLGVIAMVEKNFALAESELRGALIADWHNDLHSRRQAMRVLGQVCAAQSKSEEAIATFCDLLRELPTDLELRWLLASARELRLRELTAAIRDQTDPAEQARLGAVAEREHTVALEDLRLLRRLAGQQNNGVYLEKTASALMRLGVTGD